MKVSIDQSPTVGISMNNGGELTDEVTVTLPHETFSFKPFPIFIYLAHVTLQTAKTDIYLCYFKEGSTVVQWLV